MDDVTTLAGNDQLVLRRGGDASLDPGQPPLSNPVTRGRWPNEPEQPMFLLLVSDEPAEAMVALAQFWPELARKVSSWIGETLLRKDSRYAQRWPKLAPATMEQRRANGRLDDYPYSDEYAYQWMNNSWGAPTVSQNEHSVTASIGPAESRMSHVDYSQTKEGQYGTAPGHGVGPGNVQQKPERPLGLSEDIAGRIQNEIKGWAAQHANALSVRDPEAADALSATQAMFLLE